MGLTISQEEEISLSHSSKEIEASSNQVLHAFRREIPSFTRHHLPTSNKDSSHFQKDEQIKDEVPSNEDKHQWLCQLCQTRNEIDYQLCSHCGSTQINVYIPINNQNEKLTTIDDQQLHSSTFDK